MKLNLTILLFGVVFVLSGVFLFTRQQRDAGHILMLIGMLIEIVAAIRLIIFFYKKRFG